MKEAILLAALVLQGDAVEALLGKAEEAERGRKDMTARVTAETEDKVDESRGLASGTLALRAADRALLVELKGARTLIRKDEAAFHPFDLWRRGLGRWLQDRFKVVLVAEPGDDGLPSAVSGPDGAPLAARRARPQGRRKAYDRAAPEEGEAGPGNLVLDLMPRDRGLASLRIHVEPVSFRVVRMVVDSPARRITYSLDEVREAASLDESVFDAGEHR